MLTVNAVLFFMAALLIAVLLEPVATHRRIPFAILLVVVGFAGSEVVTRAFGVDTGIRWHNFRYIIFYVLLPVIIFQAALHLDVRALRDNGLFVFLLALPAMLLAVLVAGAILYFGIGRPEWFPWTVALLAATILSATDPAPVLAILKGVRAPARLGMLLEGESMFNDATAVVLFSLLLMLAMPDSGMTGWQDVALRFCKVFAFGALTGASMGLLAGIILRHYRQPYVQGLVTILCAYGSYLFAETKFSVSGVIAVLAAGLVLQQGNCFGKSEEGRRFVQDLWAFGAWVAHALMFLLAGATITLGMFTSQWLAMLLGIAAVLVARFVTVFGVLGPVSLLPRVETLRLRDQAIIAGGGTRGAVTAALALSLPLALDSWYTVQSIAYGVILFTLLVNVPALRRVIRRAGE